MLVIMFPVEVLEGDVVRGPSLFLIRGGWRRRCFVARALGACMICSSRDRGVWLDGRGYLFHLDPQWFCIL